MSDIPPENAERPGAWSLVQADFFAEPTAGDELLRVPRHTGERASRDWPRVQAILDDYAFGSPIRTICSRHRVGHNTLSRLVELHGDYVDTERKRLPRRLQRIASLFLDRLEMEGHLIPVNQLAVPTGIILDKLAAFEMGSVSGGAEQKGPTVEPAEFELMLARMKRARGPAAPQLAVAGPTSDAQSEVSTAKSQQIQDIPEQ